MWNVNITKLKFSMRKNVKPLKFNLRIPAFEKLYALLMKHASKTMGPTYQWGRTEWLCHVALK